MHSHYHLPSNVLSYLLRQRNMHIQNFVTKEGMLIICTRNIDDCIYVALIDWAVGIAVHSLSQ